MTHATASRPLAVLHPAALALGLLSVVACGDPGPGSGTTDGASASAETSDGSGGSAGSTTGATDEAGATDEGSAATEATGEPTGCAASHPRVGWRAELIEYHHGVAGTAEIKDDCTLVISDFSYDGAGLDVRFYGAVDEDYAGGFALSEDLLRAGGYSGETLVLTLPEGRTLDEVEAISVWCVDAGVDFGSGVFAPP